MLKAYLSHPFTNNEKKNRITARKIATTISKKAKEKGSAIAILNPCDCIRYAEDAKLSYEACMDICLKLLEGCDTLLLAPGWEKSRGCVIETAFAIHEGIHVCILPENIKDLQPNITIANAGHHASSFHGKVAGLIKDLSISEIPLKNKEFLNEFSY